MDGKDLAPVLVMAIIFMVPIIKILVNHQQKMTEMTFRLNQQQMPQQQPEHERLRQDMQDLKELVQSQAIAIDNLSNKLDRVGSQSVQERLSEANS